MNVHIVWNEGMFIAPQHFQYAEKSLRTYVNAVARLDLRAGDYGLSKLELNPDALQIGKFAVRKAAGVFPDRLYFELAKELVLDIPDGLVDEIVYLAIPFATYGAPEFGKTAGQFRYLTRRQSLVDLQDPTNDTVEAEVAEVGATLVLGHSDLSGYAKIPVARILEKSARGSVILDRSFVPHAICIGASQILSEKLEEVISLARVRAKNAANRIASQIETQSESSLFSERMELQVLNHGLFVLQNTAANPEVSPRTLYETLGSMLVQLDAMQARSTNPELIYDPLKIGECFEVLFSKLRQKLTLEKPANVIAFSWNSDLFEKRRLLRLIIPARVQAQNLRPVLALSGPDGMARLNEVGALACKLAGLSSMPDLVSHGLPGVELVPLTTAPAELRSRPDAAFFSINTSSQLWQKYLDQREALALHVDDRIQSVEATLYMLD